MTGTSKQQELEAATHITNSQEQWINAHMLFCSPSPFQPVQDPAHTRMLPAFGESHPTSVNPVKTTHSHT